MENEKIAEIREVKLWKNASLNSYLSCRLRNDGRKRPVVLVIPGGGYGCVCMDTEGYPIAEKFESLGFQTFILFYRVTRYPEAQLDAFRAIRLIRCHAEEWGADPNHLAVCGFSAGGHLSACCGTLFHELDARDGDEADKFSQRPDAMILSYPVITFRRTQYIGTGQRLLREKFEEMRDFLSLENRVLPDTPPAYIWATATDQLVPAENSLLFARAMWDNELPCELHIFPDGPHGMAAGYERRDLSLWPEQAKEFLKVSASFPVEGGKKGRTAVLTFDDAVCNHLSTVAPLLKEYGFGATFFPCFFSEEWRKANGKHLLTPKEIREISDMGFEIGNHTFSHPNMEKLPPEEAEKEITKLNGILSSEGIPAPESFAYPGGGYAGNLLPLLKKHGLHFARTTERRVWDPGKDELTRIPAFPLVEHLNGRLNFYEALAKCTQKNAAVFVFHGIPEIVHAHCNVTEKTFRYMLDYLKENDFQVLSLRDYAHKTIQG
ncbi:MAG: polysaccharide deacetylase family protein [Lentisphaeria bacterium]|nr:polysaccharide deacetylase family protein [Lentisphaeria bacterium]